MGKHVRVYTYLSVMVNFIQSEKIAEIYDVLV